MIWWIWAIWGTIFNFRETMDPPDLAANDNNQGLARVGKRVLLHDQRLAAPARERSGPIEGTITRLYSQRTAQGKTLKALALLTARNKGG